MNDKAHMQTQNGFIGQLTMVCFRISILSLNKMTSYKETRYKEDIKRREGWKMNANRKSDTPLGTSHPLNYYQENLKAERGGGRKRDETFYHPKKKVLRGMFWMWINCSY